MLPADACRVGAVIVKTLAPGVWQAELPNGHRLVARVRRRELARGAAAGLGPGSPVDVWVTPGEMSQGLVIFETQNQLKA